MSEGLARNPSRRNEKENGSGFFTGGIAFVQLDKCHDHHAQTKLLASHKLEAAVINPKRLRNFAKGIGLDAKTDAIDAKVISKYAEVVETLALGLASDLSVVDAAR